MKGGIRFLLAQKKALPKDGTCFSLSEDLDHINPPRKSLGPDPEALPSGTPSFDGFTSHGIEAVSKGAIRGDDLPAIAPRSTDLELLFGGRHRSDRIRVASRTSGIEQALGVR